MAAADDGGDVKHCSLTHSCRRWQRRWL